MTDSSPLLQCLLHLLDGLRRNAAVGPAVQTQNWSFKGRRYIHRILLASDHSLARPGARTRRLRLSIADCGPRRATRRARPTKTRDTQFVDLTLTRFLRPRDRGIEIGHHLRIRHFETTLLMISLMSVILETSPVAHTAPARSPGSRVSLSADETSLMCSCTPKISCTTSTTGNGPPLFGIAR